MLWCQVDFSAWTMKKGRGRQRVPNADCKVRNGVTLVLVKWDDTSRGQSHFVPVHCLKTLDTNSHLEGGIKVFMRHSKKIWTGEIEISRKRKAALSLVGGKSQARSYT